MNSVRAVGAALLFARACAAQEDFRVEFTAGAWLLNPSGAIQSGVVPLDIRTDLGVKETTPHFVGRLVLKPARKHRLIVDGVPYRLDGENLLERQITYAGRTYSIRDRVTSKADMDFVYGGYQYDFVSRAEGHAGLSAGVAYVGATGSVTSQTLGATATETQTVPLPLVGGEFRVWPVPRSRLLNFNGEVRGMSLGDYGRFVQSSVNAGVSVGRYVTFQVGYLRVDADVHRKDATKGFAPTFDGVVFSMQVRDR